MPYAQRDAQLKICGLFGSPQPGLAEEYLADDSPEVLAYRNPPPDPRLAAIDSSIAVGTLGATQPATLVQLKAMSAAEYSAWFDANFGTAATLIALMKR